MSHAGAFINKSGYNVSTHGLYSYTLIAIKTLITPKNLSPITNYSGPDTGLPSAQGLQWLGRTKTRLWGPLGSLPVDPKTAGADSLLGLGSQS